MPGPVRNPTEAYQQLEAIMLRQMLQSSGAFRASSTPGAQLRTDMFIETLADAVAKAGGLGIARMLEKQLGGDAARAGQASAPIDRPPAWPHASSRGTFPVAGGLGRTGGTIDTIAAIGADDLDDPNSEAPLPEDPSARSIDDYQAAAAPRLGRHPTAPGVSAMPGPDIHPDHAPMGISVGPALRALNRYRERVETHEAGSPISAAGVREKP